MEKGIFNVHVIYRIDGDTKAVDIRDLVLSDLQKHVPVGAEIVSVVAKRQPKHKLGE